MSKVRKFAITGAAVASVAALTIGGSIAASAHNGDGNQRGKDGKGGGALTSLVEDGTLTDSDVDAIRDAMHEAKQGIDRSAGKADREARQAERAAMRAAVLESLVADGTLTQDQANAIDAAIAAKQAERGERKQGMEGKHSEHSERGEGKRGGMHGEARG